MGDRRTTLLLEMVNWGQKNYLIVGDGGCALEELPYCWRWWMGDRRTTLLLEMVDVKNYLIVGDGG